MMGLWKVLIASAVLCMGSATVDVNMQQLQYLSNSLTPEECRRLYAALEDPEFDISFNLDTTERKVPLDLPCLALLLHWGSAAGQGRGASHELLSHRLRQLGRPGLADWLAASAFGQLAARLDDTLRRDPLRALATEESPAQVLLSMTGEPMVEPEDTDDWTPFDILLCVLVLALLFILLVVAGALARDSYGRKHTARVPA